VRYIHSPALCENELLTSFLAPIVPQQASGLGDPSTWVALKRSPGPKNNVLRQHYGACHIFNYRAEALGIRFTCTSNRQSGFIILSVIFKSKMSTTGEVIVCLDYQPHSITSQQLRLQRHAVWRIVSALTERNTLQNHHQHQPWLSYMLFWYSAALLSTSVIGPYWKLFNMMITYGYGLRTTEYRRYLHAQLHQLFSYCVWVSDNNRTVGAGGINVDAVGTFGITATDLALQMILANWLPGGDEPTAAEMKRVWSQYGMWPQVPCNLCRNQTARTSCLIGRHWYQY